MALTEETVIDQICIDEYGNIQVRENTRVLRDGEVISQEYSRHVVDDLTDITKENPRIRTIANAMKALTWRKRPPREEILNEGVIR